MTLIIAFLLGAIVATVLVWFLFWTAGEGWRKKPATPRGFSIVSVSGSHPTEPFHGIGSQIRNNRNQAIGECVAYASQGALAVLRSGTATAKHKRYHIVPVRELVDAERVGINHTEPFSDPVEVFLEWECLRRRGIPAYVEETRK